VTLWTSPLLPVGPTGDRADGSDGSETWFWVDTRPQTAPAATIRSGTYDDVNGRVTLNWSSTTGAKYGVEASPDLKGWTKIATGLASGGAETSYTETLGPSAALPRGSIASSANSPKQRVLVQAWGSEPRPPRRARFLVSGNVRRTLRTSRRARPSP